MSNTSLPGGYTTIFLKDIENNTLEVGLESDFRELFFRQFGTSQYIQLKPDSQSETELKITVESVLVSPTGALSRRDLPSLPSGKSLASSYRVVLNIYAELRNNLPSRKLLWAQKFSANRIFSASRIGSEVFNSVNALYDESAKKETLKVLTKELAEEVYISVMEGF